MNQLISILPYYPEDVLPACGVIAAVLLLEWGLGRRQGRRLTAGHVFAELLFALYLIGLVQLTVPFRELWQTISQEGLTVKAKLMLEPFREIRNFWLYGSGREKLINLAGNVLVFVPMGLFPPLLWRRFRRFPWSLLWCFGPTLTVELLQLFTTRATSVDDVILNAAGAGLGVGLFRLLSACGVGEGTVWK